MTKEKKRTLKALILQIDELKELLEKLVASPKLEHPNAETTIEELQFSLQLKHCEEELGRLDRFKNVRAKNLHGFFDQHPFRFIFFKNPPRDKTATCVRWPVVAHETKITTGQQPKALPAYKLEVYAGESYDERKKGVRVAFDADTEFGLDEGMFITEDGTVIVRRPGPDEKIELVVPGNPGDVPLNYKC